MDLPGILFNICMYIHVLFSFSPSHTLPLPEHFSSDTSTTAHLVDVSSLCMEDVGAMTTTLKTLKTVKTHVKVSLPCVMYTLRLALFAGF